VRQDEETGGQISLQDDLAAIYDRAFFAEQTDGSARSARIVVPLIMSVVRDVRSVVDLGCGAGVWLARFKEAGVPRVLGLDGGAAAQEGQLEIEPEEFRTANLERDIDLDDSFDLCICLEVAEHLTDLAAPVIVRNMCKLSDVVLFSAAIPGQGGTHHLNERWPSYWANLFGLAGYDVLDVVRANIWDDARVEWWYRQNLLVFANKAGLSRIAYSRNVDRDSRTTPLDIVHPSCFGECSPLGAYTETLSKRVALLEQRLADSEAEVVRMATELEATKYRRSSAQDEVARLASELHAIEDSTSWKITWPLRRLIGDNPGRRRKLRALARAGWLITSGQFTRLVRPRR
jgi:SAM-dependent methyltransferase